MTCIEIWHVCCREAAVEDNRLDLQDMSEEEIFSALNNVLDKTVDHQSAVDFCEDECTMRFLFQLLRSPNSSKACAVWAPSKVLRMAASASGESPSCIIVKG